MANLKIKTEEDLNNLIKNSIPEGKDIDYKREIPSNDDQGSLKILKTISAFANTIGGQLIYGIEEVGGLPQKIYGISVEDEDKTRLRFENLCRDGLEPPLTSSLSFDFITTQNKEKILVIEIKKSFRSPHRVKFKNHGHFYARNSAGNYALDVTELRTNFLEWSSTTDNINSFVIDRISKIRSEDGPIPIRQSQGKLITHIIPYSAFISTENNLTLNTQSQFDFTPPETHGPLSKVNLDGFLWYANQIPTRAYSLIFRNGIIESYSSLSGREADDTIFINTNEYENNIYDVILKYLSILPKYKIEGPYIIYINILDVKNYQLNMPEDDDDKHRINHVLDRNDLLLPPLFIENTNFDIHGLLVPVFNMISNAFGYSSSPNISQGRFLRKSHNE